MTANWDIAENAASYADFCRRFPKYEETSKDLAELLPVASAGLVVDLACGTGTTTGVISETCQRMDRSWRLTRRGRCSTRHLELSAIHASPGHKPGRRSCPTSLTNPQI